VNEASTLWSIILPCFNEAGNLALLVEEIASALAGARKSFEILIIDDGSDDATVQVTAELSRRDPRVRGIRHVRNLGQSAALATGFALSKAPLVATLDGDGQNDPGDLVRMLEELERTGADAICGVRARRRDSIVRRASSRIANAFRNFVTGDHVRDSGSGIRVVRREALAEIPVFSGMHRFLPTLLRLQGFRVVEVEVAHRPRRSGVSKYGIGNRLWRGILDCLVVRWYRKRAIPSRRHRIFP